MSEAFEKWWDNQCTGGYFIHNYTNDRELLKTVYTQGLLRSAEIVEDMPSSASMYAKSNEAVAANQIRLAIAAAIRKEAEDNGKG